MRLTLARPLKNKITLIVLGRSGSGKGTQARFIISHFRKRGVIHLETGRFLRSVVRSHKNVTTRMAQDVLSQGKIFPAWFAAFTWLKLLIEKGAADKHLVFDGAPRKVWEAELIDEIMRWHRRPLPLCIYVDLGVKEATRRLLGRGRADDNRHAIRNRMKFFEGDVLSVIRYFAARGRLIRINGDAKVNKIREDIRRSLKRRIGRRWMNV